MKLPQQGDKIFEQLQQHLSSETFSSSAGYSSSTNSINSVSMSEMPLSIKREQTSSDEDSIASTDEEKYVNAEENRSIECEVSNNGNSMKRARSISNTQMRYLVQVMEDNPYLYENRLGPDFSKSDKRKLWVQITKDLNDLRGAVKNRMKWMKCWNDKKNDVRKKALRLKSGIADGREPLTPLEERILKLSGYVILHNPPETHDDQPIVDEEAEDMAFNIPFDVTMPIPKKVSNPVSISDDPTPSHSKDETETLQPSATNSTVQLKKRKRNLSAEMLRAINRQTLATERMAQEFSTLNQTMTHLVSFLTTINYSSKQHEE